MRKENTNNQNYPLKEGMIMIVIILPFLFWLSKYINIDFWCDEVFTLTRYVFAPLKKTVTDYANPNNHILFNLINNIYLKFIDIKDIHSLMDQPYRIRLLPLSYTLITLLYLYLIGKKFFNAFIANLSLIILVTTIPYYNFTLQVRGYGLSIMLLTMVVYHLWSFEGRLRWIDGILLLFFVTLSLHAIPLNLYFILGIAIFYFLSGVLSQITKKAKKFELKSEEIEAGKNKTLAVWQESCKEKRAFVIVFLVGIGVMLAILLYIPVMNEIVHNRFVKSQGLFYLPTLYRITPQVFTYFLSGRYLLIPIAIVGLFNYTMFCKKRNLQLSRKTLFCVVLLLVPFILSCIRGDRPFLRVFVNLTPIFALLVSVGIYYLQSTSSILRSKRLLVALIVFLYCNLTFAFYITQIKKRLMLDIETGRKSQNIYYNYYQAHYHPSKLLSDFTQSYEVGSIPVVLYDCDNPAMSEYLNKYRITYYAHGELERTLHSKKQVYVITAFPNKFKRMITQKYPQFECKRINERLYFHNIFLMNRIT